MSFTSLLGEFRRSRAKPKPLNSLLAIEIGDRTMSAALLRRRGAAMRVEKFAQTALALDPLSSEAALVGREMQNFLEREGLREKRCLVCAPIGWTLTTRMELPDLPEADKLNMMKLHAEREMPFGLEDIRLGVSRYRTLEGNTGATLAGMPNTRLNALLAGLKAAGLKPLSVTLGAAALALGGATATAGRLVLVGDSKGLDMAVASGGGVVVLRRLEDTLAAYGQTSGLDSRSMGRQLRIAMGELPDAVRADVRGVSVYGERAISEPLLEEARRVLSQMGLQVESALADASSLAQLNGARNAAPAAPLVAAAVRRMAGLPLEFDFLAPWSAPTPRTQSALAKRRAIWIGATAVIVAAAIAGAIVAQKNQVARLERQWNALSGPAARVEAVQDRLRSVRPWFGEDRATLNALKLLAQAFPERGTIWVTSMQIKKGSEISFSGRAASKEDLFAVQDRLRAMPGVGDDLRVLQIQDATGQSAGRIAFSVSFQWKPGESDGE